MQQEYPSKGIKNIIFKGVRLELTLFAFSLERDITLRVLLRSSSAEPVVTEITDRS